MYVYVVYICVGICLCGDMLVLYVWCVGVHVCVYGLTLHPRMVWKDGAPRLHGRKRP